MKANFRCFKLSKTILLFSAIIFLQLTFIVVGIIKIRETNNFEQMKKDIIQEKKNIQIEVKNNNEVNTNKIETNEIAEEKNENVNPEVKQEEKVVLEE